MTDPQTNHLRRYPPPFEIVLPTVDNISYHLDTRDNLSTAWTSLQAHFGGSPPDRPKPQNLPQSGQERGAALSHGSPDQPHTVPAAIGVPVSLRVQETRPRTCHSVPDRTHPGASPISHPVVVLYHTEPPQPREKGVRSSLERTPSNSSPVPRPPRLCLIGATGTEP